MGDLNVKSVNSRKELQQFTQHLLKDVKAMEYMLNEGCFDIEAIRIGAEQELCLVDEHFKPAPICLEVLDKTQNPDYVTEIALFNLEVNFDPLLFEKDCLSLLESNINRNLETVRSAANDLGADIVLSGILPTIRKFDLELDNLTPFERYKAIIKAISKLRGKQYELRISGIDELITMHDSAMLEACNTGFQVHMQVKPDDFVSKYNVAQAVAAPTLSVAANSAMLFGKRLWKETRIALFQQSVDTRTTSEHLRERSPRVTFGNQWLKKSILDIYKEDIMRFRVLLHSTVDEDALEMVHAGKTPKLKALTTHNSTVYRWNRPCYGSAGLKPHLRIENRILPAGPSVIDEVANASFWLGLMNGFEDVHPDVTHSLRFDDAKSNFVSAARNGLDTRFNWMNGKKYSARELIKEELLPIARQGLEKAKVDKEDIDKFLGVIEERNEMAKTGSQWMLHSYAKLIDTCSREETVTAITASMAQNQKEGNPVHQWNLASLEKLSNWKPTNMLVEEFMTTDLFTVQSADVLELVSEIMDWQRIRYMPVEDDKGKLVGLVTSRLILRYFTHTIKENGKTGGLVKDIMISDPITISPDASVTEAMQIMESKAIGCLPVVKGNKLVGIITEGNFLNITRSLLRQVK